MTTIALYLALNVNIFVLKFHTCCTDCSLLQPSITMPLSVTVFWWCGLTGRTAHFTCLLSRRTSYTIHGASTTRRCATRQQCMTWMIVHITEGAPIVTRTHKSMLSTSFSLRLLGLVRWVSLDVTKSVATGLYMHCALLSLGTMQPESGVWLHQ